jgi:hypothetical protein
MIARLRNPRVAAGAALALALVVLIVALLARGHCSPSPATRPSGSTEGVAQRTPAALHGQGSTVAATGSCFTASVVQPAGRDAAAVQHYALTLTLRTEPASVDDLIRLLASGGCAADQQRLVAAAVKALTAQPGAITVDYLTPAGARILLPGS